MLSENFENEWKNKVTEVQSMIRRFSWQNMIHYHKKYSNR